MKAKRIVCPVDFSAPSEAALELASKIASHSGGAVFIVHVAEPGSLVQPGILGYLPPVTHAARKQLKCCIPTTSVRYEHHFRLGDPSDQILELAHEVNADLIVMGTHGRAGLTKSLVGSVTEKVVRHAPMPVLTLRAGVGARVATSA